ncbi:MAG TPA: hypothetical protein VIB00_07270 [Pyrinomonadaceae bacterium]|jgi:hypothetical protein
MDNQYLAFLVLLYAGPDQLIPLASVIGTIIGILMIGWQRVRSAFTTVIQKLRTSRSK